MGRQLWESLWSTAGQLALLSLSLSLSLHFGVPSTQHPQPGSGDDPQSAATTHGKLRTEIVGRGELGESGQDQARAEHSSWGSQGATNRGSWASEPILGVWPH